MKRIFAFIAMGFVLTSYASAQQTENLSEDLEKWSETWTRIATKTKLNADYAPGMVTVLWGEDLEKKGVRTVGEALELAPGIFLEPSGHGTMRNWVRGVEGSSIFQNIKTLVDGTSLIAGGWLSPVFNIPVEQIKRIDVVRGPCSTIHGEFAYSGVINVITRQSFDADDALDKYRSGSSGKSNRLFAAAGEHERWLGGGIASFSSSDEKINMSANYAQWNVDGDNAKAGPDALYGMGLGSFSNALGPGNQRTEFEFGTATFNYRNFYLRGLHIRNGQGDYFGLLDILPPPSDDLVFEEDHQGVTLEQQLYFFQGFTGHFKFAYQTQKFKVDDIYLHPLGVTYGLNYEEEAIRGGIDFFFDGWENHKILAGLSMDRTEPRNAWVESNVSPGDSLPLFPQGEKTRYTDEVWGGDGESRLVSSVTLEDQYGILENMVLTAGTRCDYFDDLAQAYFSPRIGMVYFLDRHIFKVQYAQAFRPPKFMELYAKNIPFRSGNPDLKPENIETWEACYIYKGADFLGRITLFHTNVEDRIVDMGTYQNEPGTVKIDGADFEFEYKPNRTVSVEGEPFLAGHRTLLSQGRFGRYSRLAGKCGIHLPARFLQGHGAECPGQVHEQKGNRTSDLPRAPRRLFYRQHDLEPLRPDLPRSYIARGSQEPVRRGHTLLQQGHDQYFHGRPIRRLSRRLSRTRPHLDRSGLLRILIKFAGSGMDSLSLKNSDLCGRRPCI